jgi:hypothetical protein
VVALEAALAVHLEELEEEDEGDEYEVVEEEDLLEESVEHLEGL